MWQCAVCAILKAKVTSAALQADSVRPCYWSYWTNRLYWTITKSAGITEHTGDGRHIYQLCCCVPSCTCQPERSTERPVVTQWIGASACIQSDNGSDGPAVGSWAQRTQGISYTYHPRKADLMEWTNALLKQQMCARLPSHTLHNKPTVLLQVVKNLNSKACFQGYISYPSIFCWDISTMRYSPGCWQSPVTSQESEASANTRLFKGNSSLEMGHMDQEPHT